MTETKVRMREVGERAVVLGASMGGLLAARVLSDFYRTVTVVERDLLPGDPAQRRGVPQGRHVHGLLSSGSRVLVDLFPGLLAERIWWLMAPTCSKVTYHICACAWVDTSSSAPGDSPTRKP